MESNKKNWNERNGLLSKQLTYKGVTGARGLLRTGKAITYEAEHRE
jgi:hypothetical protein